MVAGSQTCHKLTALSENECHISFLGNRACQVELTPRENLVAYTLLNDDYADTIKREIHKCLEIIVIFEFFETLPQLNRINLALAFLFNN